MKQRHMNALLGGLGMLALILDGRTALQGAVAGLELCLKTVIPSLFPFLFFCGLLTAALWGSRFRWLRSLSQGLGIPMGGESILIAAVLGGYPAGAAAIGDAYRDGSLTREDAAHLVRFCSNAGPAFLFGITASRISDLSCVWALWAIQLLSALLTGMLGNHRPMGQASLPDRPASASKMLQNSVKAMAFICGWIILFQILLAFLDRWFFWLLPQTAQVALTGLLELSSGCCALGNIENEQLRFLCCCVLLSFGGICVMMQTASVIAPLPIKHYFLGKLTQTVLALILALLWIKFSWSILWTGLLLIPATVKKRSGFLRRAGV